MTKNERMERTLKKMKWKWIMAQIKKEKDEGMKRTYGLTYYYFVYSH